MMFRVFVRTVVFALFSVAAFAQEPPPAESPTAESPPAEPPPSEPATATPLVSLKQVQIHVWITETNERGIRDIGTNLIFKRFVGMEEQSGSIQQINTQVFDPLNPLNSVTLPAPDPSMFPPPLRPDTSGNLNDGVQTQSGGGLTFSIIDSAAGTLDGVFRAVERNSVIDLISKPELLVIDGELAKVHAGGQFPFQSLTFDNKGIPQLNVQWRNIGVNMEIQPTVRTDDLISLFIKGLEVSDIARIDNIRGVDLPVFSTRKQTGAVLVPNGQSLVIGGLSSRVVRQAERRVPILGRIPILGIPFRGRESESSDTQLLIFVSPTVVDLRNLTPTAVNALEFWRERGWRNTEAIEEEIAVMKEEQ